VAQFDRQEGEDGTCVVRASGEVDLAVADELVRVCLEGLATSHEVHLVLGDVTFIDSTGLGALLRIRREASAAGKVLRLAEVPAAVDRLLEITGLADAFDRR
jgi:anti-anti-sigma factor